MKFNKIVLIAFLFASCTQPSKKEEATQDTVAIASDSTSTQSENNPFKLETYLIQGKVNGKDVQTLSESSVLVVNPTENQLEEMKNEYGEEDFYTIADDATYAQSDAISVIDSMGIQRTNAEKLFALFVGDSLAWTINLRKKGAPGWMLILFNKNKTPEIVPAIDINREMLKSYFELK